jgi:hypothetical protein
MKLGKYFVSLICPWCKKPMGVVNHTNKNPVISCEICPTCQDRLSCITNHVIFLVDDAWLAKDLQDANVPVYPFVKGMIITTTPPPAGVPHWREVYPILPLTMATHMGFPEKTLEAIRRSESPIILNDGGIQQPLDSFSAMRPGTC